MIEEYRRGIPTYKGENGQTVGLLCETKEQCITDDDGVSLQDKLAELKEYTDNAYANSNLYTDTQIGELINGAPTTLDTLKEIADAMEENADVVEALDAAVGSKVAQAEYDGHADNGTIHITAEERERWNNNSGGNGGDVDNIQTTSKATLSQAGWYRVAEYTGGATNGTDSNSCVLTIKQRHGSGNGESHVLRLMSVSGGNQVIVSIASKCKNAVTSDRTVTKARYAYDSSKAYLEIYYPQSVSNIISFTVSDGTDGRGQWKAIAPTLTSETVDGVTVTTTYDIPANASPVTDLDLVAMRNKYQPIATTTIATSILEKALSLGKGVYDYSLSGTSYTGNDLPNANYCYSSATIVKRSDSSINVILWGLEASFDNFPMAMNYYGGSTWEGWKTYATTEDFAELTIKEMPVGTDVRSCIESGVYFFPGFATDYLNMPTATCHNAMLFVKKIQTPSAGTRIVHVLISVNENAVYTETTTGNNSWYGWSSEYATLADLANYFKNTGGTITGSGSVPIYVKSSGGDVSAIGFQGTSGNLGFLGFNGADNPIFSAKGGSVHPLLHTGNSAPCVVVDTDPGVGVSVNYADGTIIFVKE